MIPVAAILRGIMGSWRLARGDPRGMLWFDTTPRGAWQSFWGPALVCPGVMALQAFDGVFDQALARPLLVYLIAYVAGCVAYPLLVAGLCDQIGRARHFPRFLAAYNWSMPLQIALLLPISTLAWVFPSPATSLAGALVTLMLLLYQGYIAHVSLAVSPGGAALLVALDLLVGAMLQTLAATLAATG